MTSCKSTGIENLNSSVIKYADLPSAVKKVMFQTEYIEQDGNKKLKLYTELNPIPKYEYISKQHKIMSWINEGELIRKSDKKTYELNFSSEHGTKYVVQGDYLYVPRHYNIHKRDSLKYSISRFKLD